MASDASTKPTRKQAARDSTPSTPVQIR
jgi:hypothetical protein